jgi:hypothetical protein
VLKNNTLPLYILFWKEGKQMRPDEYYYDLWHHREWVNAQLWARQEKQFSRWLELNGVAQTAKRVWEIAYHNYLNRP